MHADEIVRLVIKFDRKLLLLLTLPKSVLINGVAEVKEQVIFTVDPILVCKPPKKNLRVRNWHGQSSFLTARLSNSATCARRRRLRPRDGAGQ